MEGLTNQRKNAETAAKLLLHFGDNFANAERVLNVIESEPERVWCAEELLEATGIRSMMELLLTVARLSYLEMVMHPAMGEYCAVEAVVKRHTLRSA